MLKLRVIFWKLFFYFFRFLRYCLVSFRLLVKFFAFILKMLYVVRSFVSRMFFKGCDFVYKVCHFLYEAVRVIFFCFLVFVSILCILCLVVRELFRRRGWDFFFIARVQKVLLAFRYRLLGFASRMFFKGCDFAYKACHFSYEAVRAIFFCFLAFVSILYLLCLVVRELFRRRGWDFFFIARVQKVLLAFRRLLGFASKGLRVLNSRLFVDGRNSRVFFYLKYFWSVGRSSDFRRLFF